MSSRSRTSLRLSAIATVAAALAFPLVNAPAAHAASTAGGPITRGEVLARAQSWVDEKVPYNQSGYKTDANGTYREDCSGYVSMAWHLTDSLTTWTLPNVSTKIGFSQLQGGDILDYTDAHTFIFNKWTNKANGDFTYYAESNPNNPTHGPTAANINNASIEGWPTSYYGAYRYNHIVNDTTAGIGMWNPSDHYFHLRNSLSAGPNDKDFVFGATGMTPVAGDWDGIGSDGVGMYDSANHTFYLRNSPSAGGNDYTVSFGSAGDIPVVGDWDGNGTDTIGVWRPSNHTFYLRNSNTAGPADKTFVYGGDGMQPIAGDWDGVGADGIGMYDDSTHMVYLRNSTSAGGNDYTISYGTPGDIAVAGDFNGDGKDTVSVWNPTTHYFDINNSNTNNDPSTRFVYGATGMIPVAGDWDGQ
ncbi:hypothetical protein [Streptomyces eurythermus]|uniref:hypothetical protein n=1 Tax=Streptomyces eurythermus TaxID=42237 RepID=UPI0036F85A50